MERKSIPVGDTIPMDRAKIFEDVRRVKKRLDKVLRKIDDDETRGLIKTSVQDLKGG